ncbi:hypothetical protein GDO81_029478 [Engystomops pustulosus]|uniref:Uncharacterized protein n=1 Tax=Engystomops pustulosus TaxID=76066 RepID=A0AAV6YC02_ENGPU|nr:hypothetical protein GDO81_029478 [Engystomops pustulosus]
MKTVRGMPEKRSWEPEENILDRSLRQRVLETKKRGRLKGGGYCHECPCDPRLGSQAQLCPSPWRCPPWPSPLHVPPSVLVGRRACSRSLGH